MRDQDYNNTMSAMVNARMDLLHIKLDDMLTESRLFQRRVTLLLIMIALPELFFMIKEFIKDF